MGPFETYSKRQKRLQQAGQPVIYTYDEFPIEFRVQVIHIWRSAIGDTDYDTYSWKTWDWIHSTMCRELGKEFLADKGTIPFVQCQAYIQMASVDGVLDIIELTFRVINSVDHRNQVFYERSITQNSDSAIAELNLRFEEHAIGYKFLEDQLVRVDSQYLHAEVVEPALRLLHKHGFQGAEEEFLRAHEHYRHERYKAAITDALNAFESTMKAICAVRGWAHPDNATAKALIQTMLDNGLIPMTLQGHFTSLRAVLESGLPTVRNKTSGHGQGASVVDVPGYMAGYALHLAAANIVLLAEAHAAPREGAETIARSNAGSHQTA